MDSFRAAIPSMPPEQQKQLREQKDRLALWGNDFDENLDQLFERTKSYDLEGMTVMLLGFVASALNKRLCFDST